MLYAVWNENNFKQEESEKKASPMKRWWVKDAFLVLLLMKG